MKGITNNPNGRPKGSLNKTTYNLKAKINAIIENQFETLQYDLESIEPKERVNLVLKLIEYVLPKQREQKLEFGSLSDEEIDNLIERLKYPENDTNTEN